MVPRQAAHPRPAKPKTPDRGRRQGTARQPRQGTDGSVPFPLLARFVLFCQSRRLADAAAEIGQTPSALSIALHGLEGRLGLALFRRRGGGLDLLPSAFWLFRASARLLYLEAFIRSQRPEMATSASRLHLDLDLDFALGHVTRALLRAAQDLLLSHPGVRIDWRFRASPGETLRRSTPPGAGESAPAEQRRIRIFYAHSPELARVGTPLFDDPWVVVRRGGSAADESADGELTLLQLRPELIEAVTRFAADRGFAHRLLRRGVEPAHLADVLAEAPQARLILPSQLVPIRPGLAGIEVRPFSPRFTSPLRAEAEPDASGGADAFLAAMRTHLAGDRHARFAPRLSARQLGFFRLAASTGSISAAARSAGMAQSAMSKHLTLLDEVLGRPVLERGGDGVAPTAFGHRLGPLFIELDAHRAAISRDARDIAAHSQARVAIGTLPSSGHDSALTARIAEVATRIHAQHPDWQLQLVEYSNSRLHDLVRSGELNLAVVGRANAQVARIGLGPSEPLSVIANPEIDFAGRSALSLVEICTLPLVLGNFHLSIHQRLAEAARERSLHLRPVVDVGSLALAIAMVRRAPLCTILPASSVRQDLEAGRLVALPIAPEDLAGTLSIIFSAERELSAAERIIIREFGHVFGTE